jgi:hypothetical protein
MKKYPSNLQSLFSEARKAAEERGKPLPFATAEEWWDSIPYNERAD